MKPSTFRVNVGGFECIAVRDATEMTPWKNVIVGADDPAVAQALRQHGLPEVGVPWDFLCLVVRSGKDLVVIDTEWGCCTERLQGGFLANLRAEGVSPHAVSLVSITHHDRHHLAGIVAADGAVAFPHARHTLTK